MKDTLTKIFLSNWKIPGQVQYRKIRLVSLQLFRCQQYKLVKHTQAISRQQPFNCLSVFDHFLGLTLDFIGDLSDSNVSFKDLFRLYAVIFSNMFHQGYLQQIVTKSAFTEEILT